MPAGTDRAAGARHTARVGRKHHRPARSASEGTHHEPDRRLPEPGCDVAAEVVSRWVWPSTDGPVEHVKVFCLHGHARTLLTAWLASPPRLTRAGHRHPSRWN